MSEATVTAADSGGPEDAVPPSTTSITQAPDPTVTVVVPARNEEAAIRQCLETILAQDWTDLEVIVIDGASTDSTPEIVASVAAADPRVRLLTNPLGIIPRSLNLALRAARGKWLVRVDAHAEIPRSYVREAVARLESGDYGGVGGRKVGNGRTPAGRAIAAAMASRFGVGNSVYHYGTTPQLAEHVPFGAYSVDIARGIGGWDERLPVNQDFEFDFRLRQAGYTILFDPELVIDWECRQSIGAFYQQYRRYGKGKSVVGFLHPASLRLRHLAAPALVGSWALAAVIAPRRPVTAAAIVAPYLLGIAAASANTARTLDAPEARRYLPAAFVAMHAGWGLGFWQGVWAAARRRGLPPPGPDDPGPFPAPTTGRPQPSRAHA
jgi:succinoglycan biosynthesis protein ExoA